MKEGYGGFEKTNDMKWQHLKKICQTILKNILKVRMKAGDQFGSGWNKPGKRLWWPQSE